MNTANFSARIVAWQRQHGRHDLPWQGTRDPYRIWLSEIMLQQTQVTTVIPFYRRFLDRFPDIATLACAPQDDVLAHWSGLGYYTRARNLHRAAEIVVERHGGNFPRDFDEILALPGIGRSTAAAISTFAFAERRAILDGNVKRVFARHFGIGGYPGAATVESALWQRAEALLPDNDSESYIQGLMDLGATVCARSRPACGLCPLADTCVARATNRTVELPQRKPRRVLPRRETVMLIIRDCGEVLLKKRPPTGVWGGLWSFPEMPVGLGVEEFCRQSLALRVAVDSPLPLLSHGFTHFLLDITPQPVRVVSRAPRVAEAGELWMHPDDALQAAIPTPVRKLLVMHCGAPMPRAAL